MRTLLFDIDGTLLLAGGSGREALRRAIELEFGIVDGWADVAFSGRTDRALLCEVLAGNQLPQDGQAQGRLRRRYAALFPEYLRAAPAAVLPGVVELLSHLSVDPRVRVAVMTGNLPETATRKLEHLKLLRYVEWISGGDLDVERDALAQRTAASIRRRYGETAADDIVVIGDTPHDIRCAQSIAAPVVAVCTGNYRREQLEPLQPLAVWDDFSDWRSVFEVLVSDDFTRRHGCVLRGD